MNNRTVRNETPIEEFITKAEVARRVKRHQHTIEYWMRHNWIPYYKVGRSVWFKWSEVEAQLQQKCRSYPKETSIPQA